MSAPVPALAADRDGSTRIRLAVHRCTALQARQLAFELLELADLADHANGITPTPAPFVPSTAEAITDPLAATDEDTGPATSDWDDPLPEVTP